MAQQAEAGDVGDGVDLRIARQIRPDLVQARRGADEIGVAGLVEGFPLDRRRVDPDAEGLGQDGDVTGPGIGIAPQMRAVA